LVDLDLLNPMYIRPVQDAYREAVCDLSVLTRAPFESLESILV
jgi:hypothetical protein